MSKVLLPNGQLRKTLASLRSLTSRGINTSVSEVTRFNPSAFSKYCNDSLLSPDPKKAPDLYFEWLCKIISGHGIEVFMPMDDDTMEIAENYRDPLEKICILPIPSFESYSIASDKGTSTLLAAQAGLDCPATVLPQSIDNITVDVAGLKYPLVIKPRKSSGSRGFRLVHNEAELLSEYAKVHESYPLPIIQEYMGSSDGKYSVCLLFDRKHELKASFVQKQLRTYPVHSGPSCVQESVWYPELIEKAMPFMSKLNWFGVCELEFMVDKRDGKIKFLEINPRFWNSLYAAILAGVDFPWLLYKAALNEDFETVSTYKAGIRCRWLLPGDILHFISNKDRWSIDPPFLAGKKHNVYDDIMSFSDPLPTIGFVLSCIRYLFDKEMWKFMFKR